MIRMYAIALACLIIVISCGGGGGGGDPGSSSHRGEGSFFYPIGIYDVLPAGFATAKSAGIEMVHLYHSTQSLSDAESYLVSAENHQLSVRQNMPAQSIGNGDAFWVNWVATLSGYDALEIWYLPEEPELSDLNALDRLAEIVRLHDPNQRLVATFFNKFDELSAWCDVVDIMMVGPYPEYTDEPRSNVVAWVEGARNACPSTSIVVVPQFFDGSDFPGGLPGYPSPHEFRCDVYTGIIAGAQGVDWFYFPSHTRIPELWDEMQEVIIELKTLLPILILPDPTQNITLNIISGPTRSEPTAVGSTVLDFDSIQKIQKGAQGEYLLASNIGDGTVVVEFEGIPATATVVEVLFEQRVIALNQGAFADTFNEADVHIYKIALN